MAMPLRQDAWSDTMKASTLATFSTVAERPRGYPAQNPSGSRRREILYLRHDFPQYRQIFRTHCWRPYDAYPDAVLDTVTVAVTAAEPD